MNQLPPIVPITEMRLHHTTVLAMLGDGPVVLAQRSKPAAVLILIEEWNSIASRLATLDTDRTLNQPPKDFKNGQKQKSTFPKTADETTAPPPFTPVALGGLWQGITINDDDIEEVRKEMWAGFGEMTAVILTHTPDFPHSND